MPLPKHCVECESPFDVNNSTICEKCGSKFINLANYFERTHNAYKLALTKIVLDTMTRGAMIKLARTTLDEN